MRQGDKFEIPGEMAKVRRDIEEWRSTRTKRCRLPDWLWEAAAALGRTHGIYRTARALRVRPQTLSLPSHLTRPEGVYVSYGQDSRDGDGDRCYEHYRPEEVLLVTVSTGRRATSSQTMSAMLPGFPQRHDR